MNRRAILRKSTAGAALLSVSGCLGRGTGILGLGPCPSEQPLSANMQSGDGSLFGCNHGPSNDFVIANEREETITVTVTIESDGGNEVHGETYTLEPNERIIRYVSEADHEGHSVSVTVEGEEPVTGTWNGGSCLRLGIAVQSDNVLFGYVELYSGSPDGQHDCYKGSSVFVIFNRNDNPIPRTVHVEIRNKCTEETVELTVDIAPGDFAEITESLAVGGAVNVSANVEGGGSDTAEFSGLCGGFSALIREDGDIDISNQIG